MLRSLYSGVSGMRGFQTKMDVIGNNIANVNTPGFKGSRTVFQDVLSQEMAGATAPVGGQGGANPKQIGLGVKLGSIDTVFTPGSPMSTYVDSDVLINGNGFFVVEDGNGDRFLTRVGNFKLDAQGYLTTSDGLRVIGTDGTQVRFLDGNGAFPVGVQVENWKIGKDGTINYRLSDGTEGTVTIGLVNVNNPSGLEKVGNSLYIPTANADATLTSQAVLNGLNQLTQPGQGGTGTLETGYLEMSNVDLTQEFTEMIVAQRGFQANSRVITTSDEILQELVNLKR